MAELWEVLELSPRHAIALWADWVQLGAGAGWGFDSNDAPAVLPGVLWEWLVIVLPGAAGHQAALAHVEKMISAGLRRNY